MYDKQIVITNLNEHEKCIKNANYIVKNVDKKNQKHNIDVLTPVFTFMYLRIRSTKTLTNEYISYILQK